MDRVTASDAVCRSLGQWVGPAAGLFLEATPAPAHPHGPETAHAKLEQKRGGAGIPPSNHTTGTGWARMDRRRL